MRWTSANASQNVFDVLAIVGSILLLGAKRLVRDSERLDHYVQTQLSHSDVFFLWIEIGAPMNDFLRDLMAHSEWANAIFFHAWGKSPAREHEEMRTRVGHIVGVQSAFLSIFKGEMPGGPPGDPPPTFDELRVRAETTHADLGTLVANLNSEALSRTMHIPWFPDPPCVITLAQALVQVANAHAASSRSVHDPAQRLRWPAKKR